MPELQQTIPIRFLQMTPVYTGLLCVCFGGGGVGGVCWLVGWFIWEEWGVGSLPSQTFTLLQAMRMLSSQAQMLLFVLFTK